MPTGPDALELGVTLVGDLRDEDGRLPSHKPTKETG